MSAYGRCKAGRYKRGLDLETVYFREMLDAAIAEFLPQISGALESIGLRKTDVKNQQRPVTIETWARLDKVVDRYDISKIQIVRAALELMARSGEKTKR